MDGAKATAFNQRAWDRIADKGDAYYQLATEDQINAAREGVIKIKVTPQKWVPQDWIGNVQGKRVLCLACGGGQQAPLFSAAGAETTVFDFSRNQLERDERLAARYGLDLSIEQGDLADLSVFSAEQFDLVVNPCSVCFCPDVRKIWHEVYRVLSWGGRFLTGFIQPINYLFDPIAMEKGQFVVNRKIPYRDIDLDEESQRQIIGPERPVEFGHSLTDLIGGQIDAGFHVVDFFEDRWADPELLSQYIDVFAATLSTKNS